MKTFSIVLNEERRVSMTMYLNLESPELGFAKRPLLIVLPGGGYSMCSERESEVIALPYMAAGYQVCILRYTLKDKGGWPDPLNDYDACREVIEQHAEAWHLDANRIATVGFSAGGHLAACAATLARHKPRAAICVYPVILPDIADYCQPGMPSPHEYVSADTCPCFIAATRDDRVVSVKNALAFAQALTQAGVSFELHIYSYGEHGFSVGTPLVVSTPITPRAANWVQDSIGWLGEVMGTLTANGFTEPVLPTPPVSAVPQL